MAKYKISYSGFAYIEADNQDEAIEAYYDEESIYDQRDIDEVEKIDDFYVTWP